MQEQAAPPRFRGAYPHLLKIHSDHLPHDKFFRNEMKSHFISKDKFMKMRMEKAHKKGLLFVDGKQVIGHFQKMHMRIFDPEIKKLAGDNFEKFDDIDCKNIKCTCIDKPRYLQLFSYTCPDRDSLVYNDCKRTLFAAAKRQVKSAPMPNLSVCQDFIGWAKQTIDKLIGDDLCNFGYSYNQWYNHLTLAKQKKMDVVHEFIHGTDPLKDHFVSVRQTDPKKFHYEAICKVEVQATDGKPRMVCAIPDLIKYVMGPVCWKLEELFANKIPTYCGGMNLQQMEDKINHYIDEGFMIVAEGDGSAFDNTQDVLLKEIDRYIYNLIKSRVYHVPQELFDYVANAYYKVMDVILVKDKKRELLMTYAVLGTVFSGDCDTTLMNTLRMGLYNWYTNYKAGLTLGREFVCFSKGDDFTVMYRFDIDLEHVKTTYSTYWLSKPKANGPSYDGCDERICGLGQILKFIEFGLPNTIKFCSMRAWYTNLHTMHIKLTRDPAKFTTLSKYSRKALHLSSAKLAQYCFDQALALKECYGGITYFDDMAKMWIDTGKYYAQDTAHPIFGRNGIERDRRVTLPLEVSEQYDGFSRAPREVVIRIVGSYWETMKRAFEQTNTKLTADELRLVNDQIDAEFADRPISLLQAGRPI